MRHRDERQRLVRAPARLPVHDQLGVGRPHVDPQLPELRHEAQLFLAALAGTQRQRELGAVVAGERDAQRVRPPRRERQLERRHAALGAVDADARARRLARERQQPWTRRWRRPGRRRGERHERHAQRLPDAAALDRDLRALLFVARGGHRDLALAGLDLEGRERRRAHAGPVDRDLGARHSRSLDREAAGLRHEGEGEDASSLHVHGGLEPTIAFFFGL